MSKKLSKSKRKIHRSKEVNSLALEQLLTFPKLVIVGFIILISLFIYQLSLPSRDVEGVSTAGQPAHANAEAK